jgi:molybdopterin molybdotransferase
MPHPPLPVEQALKLVLEACRPLPPEPVDVGDALGRTLAEDVTAASDVPPFRSSAMDGYAVRTGAAGRRLRIAGESRAGAPAQATVEQHEAFRISTGAALPAGADAVLQQELVEVSDGEVTLLDAVDAGRNVREPGEDLRAGETVLRRGTRLGPAELGVAINAGRAQLDCARRPRAAVLATGDELRPPGSPLAAGQIHDSNLVTLGALAVRDGAAQVLAQHVPDDARATRAALSSALESADLVLISGGVSVGPHDHVRGALDELGAEERFWRVALRPGKPTWFGVRGETLIFGLPGNPVSAMVTFLLFARPALAALQGAEPPARGRAMLGEQIAPNEGRDECVRVRLRDGRAYLTGPQGSHVLRSMTLADALAFVPRGSRVLEPGEEVELIEI